MKDKVTFTVGKQCFEIPNAWEFLTPRQYLRLLTHLSEMATGKLSPAMVKVKYICDIFEWDLRKVDGTGLANLVVLSEQITFLFNIEYPHEVLEQLSPEAQHLFRKIPPERVAGQTIARYLCRQEYRYVLDLCFCAQLMPTIKLGKEIFPGYQVNTSFDMLTCSLTALQFIEARELIGDPQKAPILAAILYHPDNYNSATAHKLARRFQKLPPETLYGILLNFQALNNYLFTRTPFSILTAGKKVAKGGLVTGPLESLYSLAADGLGDIPTLENMNVIQYLTILRKKLIESVQAFSAANMETTEIADKTGLPLELINSILR